MPESMPTRTPEPGRRPSVSSGLPPAAERPAAERPAVERPVAGRRAAASGLPSGPGTAPSFADQIAQEIAAVRWLAPAEIRARGRRRNRIRSVVGTLTVVAVVVTGSVVAVERYGPAPLHGRQPVAGSPPSATSPDPVDIPPSALLQPEDVGPGLVVDRVDVRADVAVEVVDPTVPLGCSGYAARDRYDGPARMSRRHSVQRPPTVVGDPHSGAALVHERVFRLVPDAARQVFADARAVPELCAEYRTPGAIEVDGARLAVDAVHRWRVVAEDFAGDESVLLDWQTTVRRQDSSAVVDGPASRLVGVVRVGDLVATVDRVDEAPDPRRSRTLTEVAASRLCAVAVPRC